MLITRKSPFTGKVHQVEMPTVTEARLASWRKGGVIQDHFPELSAEHREFLMTGITPEEWAAAFAEEGYPEED